MDVVSDISLLLLSDPNPDVSIFWTCSLLTRETLVDESDWTLQVMREHVETDKETAVVGFAETTFAFVSSALSQLESVGGSGIAETKIDGSVASLPRASRCNGSPPDR